MNAIYALFIAGMLALTAHVALSPVTRVATWDFPAQAPVCHVSVNAAGDGTLYCTMTS